MYPFAKNTAINRTKNAMTIKKANGFSSLNRIIALITVTGYWLLITDYWLLVTDDQ
jgi:hypothetical protein